MLPVFLVIVLLVAGVFVGFGMAFGQISRLESRVRQLEDQTRELVSLISGAIIEKDDRERLEWKIRQLIDPKS